MKFIAQYGVYIMVGYMSGLQGSFSYLAITGICFIGLMIAHDWAMSEEGRK